MYYWHGVGLICFLLFATLCGNVWLVGETLSALLPFVTAVLLYVGCRLWNTTGLHGEGLPWLTSLESLETSIFIVFFYPIISNHV